MPTCPTCGRTMYGGAPHGPWPVQYECRCGTVVVPPADPDAAERLRRERGSDDTLRRHGIDWH